MIKDAIHIINIPKHITSHIMGKDHTVTHRRMTGGVIMLVGIALVKLSGLLDSFFIHYVADVVGYSMHGLGLVPFIEGEDKTKGKKKKQTYNNLKQSNGSQTPKR